MHMQSNERVQPGVSLEVEIQRRLNSLQYEWLTGCPEIEWDSTELNQERRERKLLKIQSGRWWPGTESNRRHEDFQSSALPTELPGRSLEILLKNFAESRSRVIFCRARQFFSR
jgi:hypothetical protein